MLPSHVAADPERLARFQREAEVLASLNHPNIAAIYGLEEADQTKALVMELVEGPTLADRITQGAIPSTRTRCIDGRRTGGSYCSFYLYAGFDERPRGGVQSRSPTTQDVCGRGSGRTT